MKILITGGAGFIGFGLLKCITSADSECQVIVLDNLSRSGSETNISAIRKHGGTFVQGDIRNRTDLTKVGAVDIVIHCAADTTVLSGLNYSPRNVIQNNLVGSLNVFDYVSACGARLIFLSTNRVYGCKALNSVVYHKDSSRFVLSASQELIGVSLRGFSEQFPTDSVRTFYGATKFSAEIMLQEYGEYHGMDYVINRLGVISGPGQFGIKEQGVVAFWVGNHVRNGELSYIGFGGTGLQVRDVLHIEDLYRLIVIQMKGHKDTVQQVFNVGGGYDNSFSLHELTIACRKATGKTVKVVQTKDQRNGDIPIYYTDNSKVHRITGWHPSVSLDNILEDLVTWYR